MHELAALAACGLLVGLALGITGGGGSIIAVPLLVYVNREPVHVALGTSLVIVGLTASLGFFVQRKSALWQDGVVIAAAGTLGTLPGGWLAEQVPSKVLLLLFAALMIAVALSLLRSSAGETENVRPHWALTLFIGVMLGFLTGFLSVGGGFLIVPALIFGLRMPMRTAVATSLLIIALNCLTSLIPRLQSGDIHWQTALLISLGGVVGSVAGTAIGRRLPQRAVKMAFAGLVLATGAFVAASALGAVPILVK